MIDATIIVEVKAVDAILPLRKAQLLTYLRNSRLRLGYLINVNAVSFGQGIQLFS
jgi:GxxExxY protein